MFFKKPVPIFTVLGLVLAFVAGGLSGSDPVWSTDLGPDRPADLNADQIPPALLARHYAFPGCLRFDNPAMLREGVMFTAQLDETHRLYAILCEPAPYNLPYAIYVVRDGNLAEAQRIYFPRFRESHGWEGTDRLYNAIFDRRDGKLRAFSRFRGAGDCGAQAVYQWREDGFALLEYRLKETCDSRIDTPFPLIYRLAPTKQKPLAE